MKWWHGVTICSSGTYWTKISEVFSLKLLLWSALLLWKYHGMWNDSRSINNGCFFTMMTVNKLVFSVTPSQHARRRWQQQPQEDELLSVGGTRCGQTLRLRPPHRRTHRVFHKRCGDAWSIAEDGGVDCHGPEQIVFLRQLRFGGSNTHSQNFSCERRGHTRRWMQTREDTHTQIHTHTHTRCYFQLFSLVLFRVTVLFPPPPGLLFHKTSNWSR